jgi:CHAT domain-containing protein
MAQKRRATRRTVRSTRLVRDAADANSDPLLLDTPGPSEFELTNGTIETALRTGEHAGLLEDYFGPDEYAELRQLSRAAATRSVRGGPRVLILPGIMGSKIGKRVSLPLFDDVYWFDPVDIARGRLAALALNGAGRRFEPLGVILSTYLKLKLRLRVAGYDADFHAFDWRLSIAALGQELIGAMRQGGDEVSLVAHSMGGLVARWALGNGGTCRRLVMLGTPNYGSFAPVMALRATYPVIRKVAALDLRHSAEELARKVFSTFPGLTQMLPSPERFRDVDLYDLANWPPPDDGLRPRADLLAGVQAVQRQLAPGDERFFLIAGVDQPTVTGLQTDDAQGFVYETTRNGDGTVPLEFARLADARTYYIAESHGSLPNNKWVARAVQDLLDRGETQVLSDAWPAGGRRVDVVRVPEAQLRTDPYGGRRGVLLSRRELRTMIEEVAAPTASDALPVAPVAVPVIAPGQVTFEPGYGHPFDRVVVGRRRQHRIDLRFALGSITEADARAVALGVFRDVVPSGPAHALDQRLGGAITELSRRRMFSANVGEIFVLPTGRHPISADLVVFAGLGSFDRFSNDVLQVAAENLIRTLVNTRVEEFATVLFGAGSGEGPASALRNLLTGFIRGLLDADGDHHFRRIVICERDRERYAQLKEELYRLSSTSLCQDIELTFDEVTLGPPLVVDAPPRRLQARDDPVYLIVRQEHGPEDGTAFDVRSSVLTAGAKATVVTGTRHVPERDFATLRRRLVDPRLADLSAEGDRLASLLLAEEVRAVLPHHRGRHLVVVHDAAMSRVPWETMALAPEDGDGRGPWVPALDRGLSHRYAADNLSVAKWLEQRVQDDVLNVLLIIDPTADLPGALVEGKRIEERFARMPGCRIDAFWQQAATRPALLAALGSGKYDVIHYAGHAYFDERQPERSGIVCHGKVAITGADLAGLGNLPTLVFFNACESGRVRRAAGRPAPASGHADRLTRMADAVGLAEAFMRGGVANFLGTYWPVGDEAAKVFADLLYAQIMQGATMGEAIQAGRLAVKQIGEKDWANYTFYGSPDFVLKEALP